MELNFDKEIDTLLRQTARGGETVSTDQQTHLDADAISAFAENALPEKTRQFYMVHLADCDRCRKILGQTILLNSEAEAVAVSPVVEKDAIGAGMPWYRRIFALPNLAYAMGALVLVLGGFIGLLVFQNATDMQSAEITQMEQPPTSARGPSLGDENFAYPQTANANMSSNMNAATTASNAATAPSMNTNSTAAVSNSVSSAANTNAPTRESPSDRPPSPSKPAENTFQADGASSAREDDKKDESRAATNVTAAEETEASTLADAPKAVQGAPPPPPSAKSEAQESLRARKSKEENKNLSASGGARQIAGKTFNRRDGVWYDAAYKNQKTINVRRGTNKYRKLDSGLRSIAESLDGTIVVVWKEKAYRID